MIKSLIFNQIHQKNLVYNTCWEDPRCDREALRIGPGSRVIMLTSAGCNALDYLLDGPESIACVDMNPRQNALLNLKMALFAHAGHDELYRLFGEGAYGRYRELFHECLLPHLNGYDHVYWAKNQSMFSGKGLLRKTFYYHGSSGAVAYLMHRLITAKKGLAEDVARFFESTDMTDQQERYLALEPRLLTPLISTVLSSHTVQSMLGVPQSQQLLAKNAYPDGMAGYFRDSFRSVFTQLPVSDNYFWRLYFYGQYARNCCPNYLLKENFETIKEQTPKVNTYTCTLSQYLCDHPGQYTHFVLLDHQDWMAQHDRLGLEEEWRLIIANAAPGARVLLRSASKQMDFLPDFVRDVARPDDEAAQKSAANDRVGTYAGTWVASLP